MGVEGQCLRLRGYSHRLSSSGSRGGKMQAGEVDLDLDMEVNMEKEMFGASSCEQKVEVD